MLSLSTLPCRCASSRGVGGNVRICFFICKRIRSEPVSTGASARELLSHAYPNALQRKLFFELPSLNRVCKFHRPQLLLVQIEKANVAHWCSRSHRQRKIACLMAQSFDWRSLSFHVICVERRHLNKYTYNRVVRKMHTKLNKLNKRHFR